MKKLYTLLVLTFPMLSVYASPLSKLSVADLIIAILFPIYLLNFVLKKNKRSDINLPVLFFIYYLLITLFIQIGMGSDVGVLSTIRYLIYLVFLLFSFKYFIPDYGIKILEFLTLSISCYVILQFVTFILFSITLPWYIPGVRVIDTKFILLEQSQYYLQFYRPTGIFLEPTHFAQFSVIFLVYLLFNDIKQRTSFLKSSLVTAAILASGSSLGLIFLVFVWGLWFLKKQRYKLSPLKIIITLFLLLIVVLTVFQIDYFKYSIERMITSEGFNGAAVGYRFNSLEIFKSLDISLVNWLIGFGRSSNEVYFTGIFYFLYCNGIVGLLIYFWICIDGIIRSKGFARILTITVLVLSIGSEFMANFGILFYLSFVYSLNNQSGQINKLLERSK